MHSTPLLSISIPTYNRACDLRRLLGILHQQAANDPRIEVIVSDNASTDGTRQVCEDFLSCGMKFSYLRNSENVGGDENIRRCYTMCGGKYAWVFGDDDVIAPGALRKILALLERGDYDLIFLAPYHFRGESDDFLPPPKRWPDAFNVTSDPVRLADLVDTHSDLMFISSVLINQERARQIVQPDLAQYVTDNIIQLAWILPVLKNLRRGIYVQAQWMGQAMFNAAGGYDAGYYYGRRFRSALDSWLEPGSALETRLINNHLTMWGAPWLDWKWNNDKMSRRDKINIADPHPNLLPIYGRNPRYWLCVYPLIVLPRWLAKLWAFPWLVRRKLLRLWYQSITHSLPPERLPK